MHPAHAVSLASPHALSLLLLLLLTLRLCTAIFVINYLGLNLKIQHGAILENIVSNVYAKFDNDRLEIKKPYC